MKSRTLNSPITGTSAPSVGNGTFQADEADIVQDTVSTPLSPIRGPSKNLRRAVTQVHPSADARAECSGLARQAKNSFASACTSADEDDADGHFSAAVDAMAQLWNYALIRDQPFKDLLAALDVALRDADIKQFDSRQRDALRLAFADLPLWHLDTATVNGHIDRLTEAKIDLLAPLRPKATKKVRIIIEELED